MRKAVKRSDFALWYKAWLGGLEDEALAPLHDAQNAVIRYTKDKEKYESEVNAILEEKPKTRKNKIDWAKRLIQSTNNLDHCSSRVTQYTQHVGYCEQALKEKVVVNIPPATKVQTQLLKHPLIEAIYIDGELLKIVTTTLEFEGIETGRFVINISTNPGHYPRMFNMDYRVSNHYDSPSIKEGKACWGNFDDVLRRFQRTPALFLLVDFVLQYLTNGADGDAGYITLETWHREKKESNYKLTVAGQEIQI